MIICIEQFKVVLFLLFISNTAEGYFVFRALNRYSSITASHRSHRFVLYNQNGNSFKNFSKLLNDGPLVTSIGDMFIHKHYEPSDEDQIDEKRFIAQLGLPSSGTTYNNITTKNSSLFEIEQVFNDEDGMPFQQRQYEQVDQFTFSFDMDDFEKALQTRESLIAYQTNGHASSYESTSSSTTDAINFSPALVDQLSNSVITTNSNYNKTTNNETQVIKLELSRAEFNEMVSQLKKNPLKEIGRSKDPSALTDQVPNTHRMKDTNNDDDNDNDNNKKLNSKLAPTIKYPQLKFTLEKHKGELMNDLFGSLVVFLGSIIAFSLLDLSVHVASKAMNSFGEYLQNHIIPTKYKHLLSGYYMLTIVLIWSATEIAKKQYDINIGQIIIRKFNNFMNRGMYPYPYKSNARTTKQQQQQQQQLIQNKLKKLCKTSQLFFNRIKLNTVTIIRNSFSHLISKYQNVAQPRRRF